MSKMMRHQGYKTMSLLENKADLYLHSSKIFKWDVCAPNAILNNLGGKLTKRNGERIDYVSAGEERNSVDGIIASLHYYDYYYSIFKKFWFVILYNKVLVFESAFSIHLFVIANFWNFLILH